MKNLTCLCIGIVLCTELIFTTSAYSQKSPANTNIQKNGPASNYLEALLRFEPWAESVWKDYPQIENSGYFGDGQGEGSHGGIRGTCNKKCHQSSVHTAFHRLNQSIHFPPY